MSIEWTADLGLALGADRYISNPLNVNVSRGFVLKFITLGGVKHVK